MYETLPFNKIKTNAWLSSLVDLIAQIKATLTTPNSGPEMPSCPVPLRVCELHLQHDIFSRMSQLSTRLQIGGRLFPRLMMTINFLYSYLINETNSPSARDATINEISNDSMYFVSKSLAMTNHWLGVYDNKISFRYCLYRELATIMIATASVGHKICSQEGPDEDTKSFYLQLHGTMVDVCEEFQRLLNSHNDTIDSSQSFDVIAMSMSPFKPILQLRLSENIASYRNILFYKLLSLGKLVYSLSQCYNADIIPREGLILLQMLKQITKRSTNDLNGVIVELSISQLFELMCRNFRYTYQTSEVKKEFKTIIKLCEQWLKLDSSELDDSILLCIQKQLIKLQLFIKTITRHSIVGIHGDSDDDEGDPEEIVNRTSFRVVNSIPYHDMFEKLGHIRDKLDIRSLVIEETNINLLSTYLFWVEKTLEVLVMRIDLTKWTKGIFEEPIRLNENFSKELLLSLDWIEDAGTAIAAMHSIFQLTFIDKHVKEDEALDWLSSKFIFPFPPSIMDPKEQERATQCIQEAALKWKIEYQRIIDDLNENSSKSTEISIPSLSMLSLFCK
jgi:hypothetical protein